MGHSETQPTAANCSTSRQVAIKLAKEVSNRALCLGRATAVSLLLTTDATDVKHEAVGQQNLDFLTRALQTRQDARSRDSDGSSCQERPAIHLYECGYQDG